MTPTPRCEALVCIGRRLVYNAVTYPKYVECPRDAEADSHFCPDHQRTR